MNVATYTYSARPVPEAHDRQRIECESLARELGYKVTHAYDDEGGTRLSLASLLADAANGTLTVLLISRLDRLGRTLGTAPRLVNDLRHAGVTVYAAAQGNQPLNDSPTLPILCAMAGYEDEHAEYSSNR